MAKNRYVYIENETDLTCLLLVIRCASLLFSCDWAVMFAESFLTIAADSFCCLVPDRLPVLRDKMAVPVTRPALSVSGIYSSIFH